MNPGTRGRARETDTAMQDGKKMGGQPAKYEIGHLYRRRPTRKLNQKERNEEPAPETTTSARKGEGGRMVCDDDCGGILPGVKMGP